MTEKYKKFHNLEKAIEFREALKKKGKITDMEVDLKGKNIKYIVYQL